MHAGWEDGPYLLATVEVGAEETLGEGGKRHVIWCRFVCIESKMELGYER